MGHAAHAATLHDERIYETRAFRVRSLKGESRYLHHAYGSVFMGPFFYFCVVEMKGTSHPWDMLCMPLRCTRSGERIGHFGELISPTIAERRVPLSPPYRTGWIFRSACFCLCSIWWRYKGRLTRGACCACRHAARSRRHKFMQMSLLSVCAR